MDKLADRLKTKLAMEFEKLATIKLGGVAESCPYWAIANALAFEVDQQANLVMLAPYGDWIARHTIPHHALTILTIDRDGGFPFGKGDRTLDVMHAPATRGWLVVGETRAFNPHFWEPSVIPNRS